MDGSLCALHQIRHQCHDTKVVINSNTRWQHFTPRHGYEMHEIFETFRPLSPYYTMRFPYVALAIRPNTNEMYMQHK